MKYPYKGGFLGIGRQVERFQRNDELPKIADEWKKRKD
jgi:hypothetical protein